jgi:branched-chain amino acid transport system ATP-binding protein
MLRVENLQAFYGRIQALKGVSLTIDAGEIVALVGANGAGKTTLLRTLSGVHPIGGGRILFEQAPIQALKPHQRVDLGISQSPEGRQVFKSLSVEDNLRLGAFRRHDHEIGVDLDRMYGMFPILAEKRRRAATDLSGGQQQMLAIGRALMARPRLLLLDEPSLGLAPMLIDQIFETLAQLRQSGITILVVEQNASVALGIADRGYVLETGKVVHTGTGRDLLEDPVVRRAYLGI